MIPRFPYTLHAILIAAILLALLLVSAEAGYVTGHWRAMRGEEKKTSLVEQGLLTLLALLLAFGVSIAETRYEERRANLVAEANAIGTSYLRTSYLPGPLRNRIRSFLLEYLDARIEFYSLENDPIAFELNNRKCLALQNSFWKLASNYASEHPLVTASLLLTSLNETIDLQAQQSFAFAHYVPRSVIDLLVLTSLIVMALVGYGHGIQSERHPALTAMFSFVIAMTLFVILDLDRPRRGWIRFDSHWLVQLREDLRQR